MFLWLISQLFKFFFSHYNSFIFIKLEYNSIVFYTYKRILLLILPVSLKSTLTSRKSSH